jgi:hypothetical protein
LKVYVWGVTATIVTRHVVDCPGVGMLKERLAGLTEENNVSFELVATPEDAARIGFYGSPTILIDGTDPFPVAAASPGLSCRLYRTQQGVEPAPSIDQLKKTLSGIP